MKRLVRVVVIMTFQNVFIVWYEGGESMKKVEMYEAKNGKLCKTQVEAEKYDLQSRLKY